MFVHAQSIGLKLFVSEMIEKQLRSSNLSDRAKKIVKRLMKKEKDKEVEVGWCKSTEVVDHTEIVLAMYKKNKWAIDFDPPNEGKEADSSAIFDNG